MAGLVRSTLDALKTGQLIVDDRHVLELVVTDAYGSPQGCEIRVESLAARFSAADAV